MSVVIALVAQQRFERVEAFLMGGNFRVLFSGCLLVVPPLFWPQSKESPVKCKSAKSEGDPLISALPYNHYPADGLMFIVLGLLQCQV